MNKICMYTICRNESKRVEAWWKSASEADKVAVIIHDSDDDTEEKLRNLGALIKETHYDEWRFDVGKNDALDWAREIAPDCNILVYTALDEIFDPGWAEKVKAVWTKDTLQCEYNFVQTHDDYGNDLHQTKFNWIHSNEPNWYWKYPVHESLLYEGDCEGRSTKNLFDEVKLEHWPENNDGARKYGKLLEKRYEEYKDHISLLYLVVYYTQEQRWDDALRVFGDYKVEENTLAPNEAAYLIDLVGECYQGKGNYLKAKECYSKLVNSDIYPGYRDPYINWAFMCMEINCPYEALALIKKAFSETHRYFDWIENPTYWNYAELQAGLGATLGLRDFTEALGFVELIKYFNIQDPELPKIEKGCLEEILNG